MKIKLSELANVKGVGQKTLQRIREYKLADEGYVSKYDPSLHLDINSVNKGECLELMNGIKDKSVDMILADLPYGTTACSWDSVIDLDKLWLQYERIIKDNGAIVLTASQPFTNTLISSNKALFKYSWVWNKIIGSGTLLAKKQPLRAVEDICIFYKHQPTYNPQMRKRDKNKLRPLAKSNSSKIYGDNNGVVKKRKEDKKFPINIIEINSRAKELNSKHKQHPTQKPVALFEYLIKTYTNEGDLILDNVAGSGTTGVAAQNTNRNYILIEQEQKYIDVINERLK
jgi:site-specific DNA-methyltransferase (adenine-specific)